MRDQEAKKDAGKLRLSLVPAEIIQAVARVRTWATENKYPDPESYKRVEIDRYHDALLRHVYRYLADPDGVDEESGLSHLDHVACNVAFLCEMKKAGSSCNGCQYQTQAATLPCAVCRNNYTSLYRPKIKEKE